MYVLLAPCPMSHAPCSNWPTGRAYDFSRIFYENSIIFLSKVWIKTISIVNTKPNLHKQLYLVKNKKLINRTLWKLSVKYNGRITMWIYKQKTKTLVHIKPFLNLLIVLFLMSHTPPFVPRAPGFVRHAMYPMSLVFETGRQNTLWIANGLSNIIFENKLLYL